MKRVNNSGASHLQVVKAYLKQPSHRVIDSLKSTMSGFTWKGKSIDDLTEDEALLLRKRLGI